MAQTWQAPAEIRLVPAEPVPDRLFVCLARLRPEAAAALKRTFESGRRLPQGLKPIYDRHLLYTYQLGERGAFWEAGPSTDFARFLYIYSTGSLEEARVLMRNDPLYLAGIVYEDQYFEWAIHTPFWRTNLTHREMIENLMKENGLLAMSAVRTIEKKVEIVTPPTLFVSLAKTRVEYVQPPPPDAPADRAMPDFLLFHVLDRLGPGGSAQMGYDWEAGPSLDFVYDLSILSVNSMETARRVRECDHFSLQDVFYDTEYFEWCIHLPFKKASPAYKNTLRRLLKEAGARPDN